MMDKYDDIFTIEKQANTENYLRNLWKGKEKTAFSAYSSQPVYRQLENSAEMAEKAAENILSGLSLPGFNIPRFIADYGTVSTAAYWGGKRHTPVGGCIGIDTVIKNAEQVSDISPEHPLNGDVKRALTDFNAVSDKLGTTRLRSSFIDIQGPLNTAALLWQQDDFMASMYEEPEAVHQLLEIVTEQLISIIKATIESFGSEKLSGPLWPFIWLPADIGIAFTEDYMPLLSPKLYKEFGIPYIEKINREFGGIFLHCCGEYEHQLENLKNADINLLGLEFTYPYMNPKVMFNTFGSSAIYVPFLGLHGKTEFPKHNEYLRYLKSERLDETKLWFLLDSSDEDFNEQVKIVEGMI